MFSDPYLVLLYSFLARLFRDVNNLVNYAWIRELPFLLAALLW